MLYRLGLGRTRQGRFFVRSISRKVKAFMSSSPRERFRPLPVSIDGDGSQIEVARAPTENPLSWDLDDAAFDDSLAGTLSQSDEASLSSFRSTGLHDRVSNS